MTFLTIPIYKSLRFIGGAIFVSFLFGCSGNYLNYQQHILSKDGRFNYCLYFDGVGIGDPGYYILRIEKNIDPKKLYIKWSSGDGLTDNDSQWIRKRQILFNYEEGSFLSWGQKIEIKHDRYLIFSRGGCYFALYDLKINRDIVNIASPWNDWQSDNDNKTDGDNFEQERSYKNWVKLNLDKKIRDYMATNTPSSNF